MNWLLDPEMWFGLITLSLLEIVLGIDNLVFLAILTERLPPERRLLAERLGLSVALLARLGLLAGMVWIVGMGEPVFTIFDQAVSWRDIVLVAGGIFLLAKGTHEIHGALEGDDDEGDTESFGKIFPLGVVLAEMAVLDVVFSLDSVVTAVGMVNEVLVMAAALVVAMGLMLAAAAPLAGFLERRPTVKILALCFLLVVGTSLIAEGAGAHVPKATLYFAMGLAVGIEALNLLARHRQKPVKLRNPVP